MAMKIIACLAGGRNKLAAYKSYKRMNDTMASAGVQIRLPHTICDLTLENIPSVVRETFGGTAVVKVPYSNAGQGVYTITSERELEVWCFIGKYGSVKGKTHLRLSAVYETVASLWQVHRAKLNRAYQMGGRAQ